MILRRWDYGTRSYEPFEVPDEWKPIVYSDNMSEKINCPHCGKEMLYGTSYTSLEIHTGSGFGYAVCSRCYDQEAERRRNAKSKIDR